MDKKEAYKIHLEMERLRSELETYEPYMFAALKYKRFREGITFFIKSLVVEDECQYDDPNNEIPNREAYEQIKNSLVSEPVEDELPALKSDGSGWREA